MSARKEAEERATKRQDDILLGMLTAKMWEGIILHHNGHTLEELAEAQKVVDRLEGGLAAISNASELSTQEFISERCEAVLRYASKMIEISRPHGYDSDQLKKGKFEFYKRVLEMQKNAVQLLETFTDIGRPTSPEKLNVLMNKLQKAGIITADARKDISEMIYPPEAKVLKYKPRQK
jgi:hypothetical protein